MNDKRKKPMVQKGDINDPNDAREGQGFNDARGDSFRQRPDIPRHNGLNINNDPTSKRDEPRGVQNEKAE